MNPALGARCFLLISFTSIMTNLIVMHIPSNSACGLKAGESVNIFNMVVVKQPEP